MARRRSSFNRSSFRRNARREVYNYNPFANLRLPRSPARYYSMNDFRTFHPERALRPVLRASGRTVRFSRPLVRPSSRRRSVRAPMAHKLYFEAPHSVLVCVRRKQRKEVLHAFGKTGRSGQRRPRRSERSYIHC